MIINIKTQSSYAAALYDAADKYTMQWLVDF